MAAPLPLSPAKVVLLAVHFATHADVDSLASLAAQHPSILRHELVLRIILTHLPETVDPAAYVPLVKSLATKELLSQSNGDQELDTSPVDNLSDEQASRRVKKLRLLQLLDPNVSTPEEADTLTTFLLLRGYRMDEEAGMLAQVPDLLTPFLQDSPIICTWMASTVLPLLRRNYEYYPQRLARHSLHEFQNLPDRAAVEYLLAGTGVAEEERDLIGRDLRGMVIPWLLSDERWKRDSFAHDASQEPDAGSELSCPGWEQALEWLISQASNTWPVAVKAIEQWDGPSDFDVGDLNLWLQENQQQYLDRTYARAALASAYLIPESTIPALEGAFSICSRITSLMDSDSDATLQSAAAELSPVPKFDMNAFPGIKTASFMRNDLLQNSNPLTAPKMASVDLLLALVLSAFLLTRAGVPCTIRRAGDLAFIRDRQEQKGEFSRLLRALSSKASRNDDNYWVRARREILWLHSWGIQRDAGEDSFHGIFSAVPIDVIETEFLKTLLSNSRYSLAKSIYEDSPEKPLTTDAILETVQSSALSAFDNASNPNRTRGGLKKCDEIIHAFPKTVGKSLPVTKRIESLLRATHALSDYRLVLKQGEPFSPVVLRVHSDPIAIIDKVLEQNPKAYTRLNEFLELGNNLVHAGLSTTASKHPSATSPEDQIILAEKRIVAMCIEAALREDDFETAYSYVVSRLGTTQQPQQSTDDYSWNAALSAGKYVRTEHSLKPTHLGTASGNPEIRHLEQRIECLATALRIAPPSQLQEILKTFRRCEEQLDFAVREEAAKEDAWDAAADMSLPGAFDGPNPDKAYPPRNMTASGAARQADEAPMSLFDLSRATARLASRNFQALSNLQGSAQSKEQQSGQTTESGHGTDDEHGRVRKRDQLREAATGTLVSGVGWLIGANK